MTAPLAGIVSAASTAVAASGTVVAIDLDARAHRFLRDHLVGGRPLLSTVMAIETICCAVQSVQLDVSVRTVSNVRVGPPIFLPATGTGRVEVSVSGGPLMHCELRSPRPGSDPALVHFTADVDVTDAGPGAARSTGIGSWTWPLPRTARGGHRVGAGEIYALYFHGESFRVLEAASFCDGVLIGRLARDLPPIVEPARGSVMAPLLIELCLQTAGLWELAEHGRLMIPSSIDRIDRWTDADSATPGLTAVVAARADRSGARVFDAAVLDDVETVHLTVRGYRTTEFAYPPDATAVERIRAALGVL